MEAKTHSTEIKPYLTWGYESKADMKAKMKGKIFVSSDLFDKFKSCGPKLSASLGVKSIEVVVWHHLPEDTFLCEDEEISNALMLINN